MDPLLQLLLTHGPVGALAWILWVVMNRHLDQSKAFAESLVEEMRAERAERKAELKLVHQRITALREEIRRTDHLPPTAALTQKEEIAP